MCLLVIVAVGSMSRDLNVSMSVCAFQIKPNRLTFSRSLYKTLSFDARSTTSKLLLAHERRLKFPSAKILRDVR